MRPYEAWRQAERAYAQTRKRMLLLFKRGDLKRLGRANAPFRHYCVEVSGLMLAYALLAGAQARIASVWVDDGPDEDEHHYHDVIVFEDADGLEAWADPSCCASLADVADLYSGYEIDWVPEWRALQKVEHLMTASMRNKLRGRLLNNPPEQAAGLVLVHPSSLDSYAFSVDRELARGLRDAMTQAVIEFPGPVWILYDHDMAGPYANGFERGVKEARPDAVWIEHSDAIGGGDWKRLEKRLPKLISAVKLKKLTLGGIWWDSRKKTGCATHVYKFLRRHLPKLEIDVDEWLTGSEEDAEE